MSNENDDEDVEIQPPDIAELFEVHLKYKKIVESNKGQRFHIDLEQVHKLAAMMSTQAEIAAILGISHITFKRRLADNPAIREAYDSGKERFKTVIRRRLLGIAMSRRGDSGKTCMFLAKNFLGMSERSHVRIDDASTPGMSAEMKRQHMAELMGEDPRDPDSGLEDDGEAD